MIQINLIPDIKQEFLNAQRTRNVVVTGAIIAGVAAVGVVVLALVALGGQHLLDKAADDDIDKWNNEIVKVEDASSILTVQNQLSTLKQVGDSKQITSRLLDATTAALSAGTTSVAFSSISLQQSEDGVQHIILEGQSAHGFSDVEILTKVLYSMRVQYVPASSDEDDEKKDASSAKAETVPLVVDSIAIEEKSLARDENDQLVTRFKLSFAFAPELLAATSTNVRIVLGHTGNVTDSYLSIPHFVNRPVDVEGGQ